MQLFSVPRLLLPSVLRLVQGRGQFSLKLIAQRHGSVFLVGVKSARPIHYMPHQAFLVGLATLQRTKPLPEIGRGVGQLTHIQRGPFERNRSTRQTTTNAVLCRVPRLQTTVSSFKSLRFRVDL